MKQKRVMLTITPEDVKQGIKLSNGMTSRSHSCPVYQSASRLFDNEDTMAGVTGVRVGRSWWRYSQPLQHEVNKFDRCGEFKPGRYLVTIWETWWEV